MKLSLPKFPQSVESLFFPERKPFAMASQPLCENRFVKISLADKSAPVVILFPSTELDLDIVERECTNGLINQGLTVIVMAHSAKALEEYIAEAPLFLDEAISLLEQEGVDAPIFVMGSAIGALAAIEAVSQRQSKVTQLKGMILESCIENLQNWLLIYASNCASDFQGKQEYSLGGVMQTMEEIIKPTLIFHGAQDQVTAVAAAEKLQAASGARNKKFFIIPGAPYPEKMPLAHFGGSHYFQEIRSFINTVCGINTWRQRRQQYKYRKED